jgi:hypothetical protein
VCSGVDCLVFNFVRIAYNPLEQIRALLDSPFKLTTGYRSRTVPSYLEHRKIQRADGVRQPAGPGAGIDGGRTAPESTTGGVTTVGVDGESGSGQ